MNPRVPGVFALGLTLTACGGDTESGDTAGTTAGPTTTVGTTAVGTTSGTSSPVGLVLQVLLTWNEGAGPCEDTVDIAISGPEAESVWQVGLVRTGVADGWLGEDCLAEPCHEVAGTATLARVADCEAPDFDGSSVVLGQTTAFGAEDEEFLTWVFRDEAGFCLVYGADPAYYAALGCSEAP